jgi:hypothetical protein
MNVSMNPIALAAIAKHSEHVHGEGRASNPAKQAKAADPAVKGADFGALVSQFARAKHAPPAIVTDLTAPAISETPAPTPGTTVDIVV